MHCTEARQLIAEGHIPLLYRAGHVHEPYDEFVDWHIHFCEPCRDVVRAERQPAAA